MKNSQQLKILFTDVTCHGGMGGEQREGREKEEVSALISKNYAHRGNRADGGSGSRGLANGKSWQVRYYRVIHGRRAIRQDFFLPR